MGSGVALRGLAGEPAGLCGAGRAHTWALFLQRAARDSAPRRLIKLRGAGLMRSTCVGPARPRPRPRPCAPSCRPYRRSTAHPGPGGLNGSYF